MRIYREKTRWFQSGWYLVESAMSGFKVESTSLSLHSHTELQPRLLRIKLNSLPCSHTDV